MPGVVTFSLNPILDLYILLVLSRQVLRPEGKLFFTWTLHWTEVVTDPVLRLAGALRLPGWRCYSAVHGGLLLVVLRAVFYALAWAVLPVDPPANVVMGCALFAFPPTHWVAATLFSAASTLATAVVITGWFFLSHSFVSLGYRHTHVGLLLSQLYSPWERLQPPLRLALWAVLYALLTSLLCALPAALVRPAWSTAGIVGSFAQGLLLAILTLHAMLPSLELLLLVAAVFSWLPHRCSPLLDAIEALAEALAAPLRSRRLGWGGLDFTYPAMLLALMAVHIAATPVLGSLARAAGVA